MNRRFVLIALAVLCTAAAASPSVHAAASAAPWSIEELRSRLNLTPEQESRIAPLAEQRRLRMQQILDQRNAATSRKDKRSLMQQARQAQDEFVRNVEPVLTAGQRSEWQKMREEGRRELKQRWQENR